MSVMARNATEACCRRTHRYGENAPTEHDAASTDRYAAAVEAW